MAEEDDYEGRVRFDMDNDYEGGCFIGDEFYYKRKKEKPIQSRDDALYGIFADGDSSDDSDSGRRRSGKRRRGEGSTADLTKPVQFVSTGTVMPSQELEEKVVKNDGFGEERSNAGLGFGLGFHADTKDKEEQEDLAQDGEESFLPSAFGQKIKEGAEQRKKEKEKEREKDHTSSKKTSYKRDVTGMSDVGKFETYTKGIGMKLMKMMGYKEGTGLGKNEQGIVAPVEAKLRPKNMGMGFNDYKEAKLIPVLEESVPFAKSGTVTSTVPVLSKSRERLWSKNKQGRKKSEILTKDELLAKKEEQGVEMVQKIIDMRHPQVRVLTNLENLNSEMEFNNNNNDSNVPMPELQYNIRLIVETTEADIQTKDRNLRREREKVASLLKEKEKLEAIEKTQRKQLETMETIMAIVDQVKEDNGSGLVTLEYLLTTFSNLKLNYKEEYKMCNLSIIICAFAHPLLLKIFQNWNPLHDPLHGLHHIQSFKNLLQGDQPFDYSDSLSPYTQLINEIIFPAVRINCIHSWLARDPEPMLKFLETWDSLLPPVIINSILDNIIMPKLNEAVNTWEPLTENVPIHVWIHPWLPLMGNKLEILYSKIEYKFGCVLQVWNADDKSGFAILSPWKDVFAPLNWERLMVRFIVPKLRLALQAFEINPANQKLDIFHYVMIWAGFVPVNYMVHLLETEFFSKWNNVLYHWLCSNPNFNEVMNWYMGWKSKFPEELLSNERIRVLFTLGLDMMNQAVEGMQVVPPGTRENVSYLRATEKRQLERIQQNSTGANLEDLSFKERVQKYASEHGLLFMPRVGKFYNSYQVYDFGNLGVYVDSVKRLIYSQVGNVWSAVSLSQLMEMNRNAK